MKGRAADIARVSRELLQEVRSHFSNLRACLDERERAIEAQLAGIGTRKQARIGVIVADVEGSLADAQGLLRVCTASEEETRSPFGGSHPAPHEHIPRLLNALARIRALEAGGGSLVACDEGVSFDVRLDVGTSERGIEGIALVDSPGHLPEPPPTPVKKTQPQPQLQVQPHQAHQPPRPTLTHRPSPGELLSWAQPAPTPTVPGWNVREMGSGFRLGEGGQSCLALSSYLQTAVWGTDRGASDGIHHWLFEVTAMAVHTWIGLVPRDRDVYSFVGRCQEAVAYSSAGTIVEATKITTKPGAARFTSGDVVGLILHCAAATLTVTINGIAAHTFHGVPNPAWPAISMPFPGNVTVKSYEKVV